MTLAKPKYATLMRYARMLGFGEIHTKVDSSTGLHAIIAIHSTTLGPALGGCRYAAYPSPEHALEDALRLAYGMTLKASVCGLSQGGGKAVIIKPPGNSDRTALFKSFGDFVNTLNGRYITAVDLGSNIDDMCVIFERTPYVCGAKGPGRVDEDPSHSTGQGVFCAMQAAIEFLWRRKDFSELHVVVQGVGHAGYHVVKNLVAHNARVSIADINQDAIKKCVDEFNVTVIDPAQVEKTPCDIFSPCALGGTITHDFIVNTKAKIIAGTANNQLSHHNNAETMRARGILYLPDFVINSGGLINAATTYRYQDLSKINAAVNKIYDITLNILERGQKDGKTTTRVAEEIAFERLRNVRKQKNYEHT